MVTAAETMDTTVATMGIGAKIMGTRWTRGNHGGHHGYHWKNGYGDYGGGWRDRWLFGVGCSYPWTGIRTMGMGILTTDPITITILTPATTGIPATTDIRRVTIRITNGYNGSSYRYSQHPYNLYRNKLVMAEDITRIPARGIATGVECITAESARPSQWRAHHYRARPLWKSFGGERFLLS